MHDSDMGDPPARTRRPLVERSDRQYETLLVVNPGANFLGVALGALNPDGECQFVSGRTRWEILEPHLSKLDLFVGCYWTDLEYAQAFELAENARKHGCETAIEHATFHGLQARVPSRVDRAERTLERLVRPRGFTTRRMGWFSASYMMKMLPRKGVKL